MVIRSLLAENDSIEFEVASEHSQFTLNVRCYQHHFQANWLRTDCFWKLSFSVLSIQIQQILMMVYLIRLNNIFFTILIFIISLIYFFVQLVLLSLLPVQLELFLLYLQQHNLPFVSAQQIFSVLPDLMQFSRWYAHWSAASNQVSNHLKVKIKLIFS